MPDENNNDQGQNQQQSWNSALPDDLKSDPSLKDFKDVGGLAKSYVEAQKLIGSSIRLPREGAGEDELSKFYNRLGRPEKIEGYEYKQSEDHPEILKEDYNSLREIGYKIGLTKTQFQELAKWNDQSALDIYKSSSAKNQGEIALKEKELNDLMMKNFGGEGDDNAKQANVDKAYKNARDLISKFLLPTEADTLLKLDNKALVGVVSILNKVDQKYIKEGGFNPGGSSGADNKGLKTELTQLINELGKLDSFSPEYDAKVKRKNELYAQGVSLFN